MIPPILILDERIDPAALRRLVEDGFGDMVKYVIDLERRRIAIGGELHADLEQALVEAGSQVNSLWGATYFPGRGPDDCIEFTSLINISPMRGNKGMEIADPALRRAIRELTNQLVGSGDAL